MLAAPRHLLTATLDALAFSGAWAGLVAGALTAAAARAIGVPAADPALAWACGLAIGGTWVVYGVDRLRDVERDAASSPARSAFLRRRRTGVVALVAAGALLAGVAVTRLPAGVFGVCAVVACLGLLHRRLKGRAPRTTLYVTAAWIAVVVGLPALLVPLDASHAFRLLAITTSLGLAIASNVLASTLRGTLYDASAAIALRRARRLAAGSALVGLLAPGAAALAWIGALAWLGAMFFRPGERYGLIVLDGTLLVGGLAATAGIA